MELYAHYNTKPREGRVLVVDDEAAIRKTVRLSLTQAGYDVVEAEDGYQAVQAMREGDNALAIDTILCDIRMPRINGVDAIAYFRAQYPSKPVVVLTGYPDVELAISLMKLGVRDYLVKPITKGELLRVIKEAVSQHILFKDQFVA